MTERINALIFTNDLKLVKDLQAATKLFQREFVFLPCSSGEKFLEFGGKAKLDAVMVDEAFVDPLAMDWVQKWRSKSSVELGNATTPFFLLGGERDSNAARKVLKQGFEDIFTTPVDSSLFFQKLQQYLPGRQFLKDKLLFNLGVKSEVEVAIQYSLVNASEYGVTIHADREMKKNELFALYGAMLPKDRSCLAKVIQSTPLQEKPGFFESRLILVAPSKEALTAMRLWLKQEYIRMSEDL